MFGILGREIGAIMGTSRYRRFRAAPGAILLLTLLVILAGCNPLSAITAPGATATSGGASSPTATATENLDQRIDAYIAHLTPSQQIGQTLMLAVYANGYNANLDQALTQWDLGSAIIFPNYNGGQL